MRLDFIFVVVVAVLAERCYGYTQSSVPADYMLCRKVPSIFGSTDNDGDDADIAKPGPVGVEGPPGRAGLPGPRGEPDYDKVKELVAKQKKILLARLAKMEAELKYLKANPPKFSGPYTGPTASPEELLNERKCMSKYTAPISDGTKCYAIHGNDGLSLTLEYAESNCSHKGGRLANPDSRHVYNKIYDYADKTFSTVIRAWTGLKYENKLAHSDGVNATFAKWSAYYPKRGSQYSFYRSYTSVIMYIDTSSFTIGLQNLSPSRRRYSHAICEYDLSGPYSTASTTTTTEEPDTYDDDYYYY